MSVLKGLEPQRVFHFFEEISAIPRGTFNMKQISDYCVDFAKKRNLDVIQDEFYNIIIKKNGTAGYEKSEPVIIQGHLDMVCEKTEGSNHDFAKDGLELMVEDGFVKAKETTLGADNGIAIAYALAVLDSSDLSHPPIEAVFTVDEEVGMDGAALIDLTPLRGNLLLNIDSEEEGTILAGCAGGFRQTLTLPLQMESRTGAAAVIEIKGLRGGHSGADIDQQRGNANKLMARLLHHLSLELDLTLIRVNGGTKDNVIATACRAEVMVSDPAALIRLVDETKEVWLTEFEGAEPNLSVSAESRFDTVQAMTKECSDRVIHFLVSSPYGVQAMIRSLRDKVETSLNMGVLETGENDLKVIFLVRSSVESKMKAMEEILTGWARQLQAESKVTGKYPAWTYKPDSRLRLLASEVFQELFDQEPVITTIHAGLECGLLSGKRPALDCISFGPDIADAHSVYERLDIDSTMRTWEFIKALLKRCK